MRKVLKKFLSDDQINFYRKIKSFFNRINKPKPKSDYKIFCISMQRSGTTSVGDFFEDFGYPRAKSTDSGRNKWTKLWYEGDFEKIFASADFKSNQVFEDDPWWAPEFYKYLYHRFPNAKFILITRNTDKWFTSMMNHSNGKTLGNTKIHAKLYRREKEYYDYLKVNPQIKSNDKDYDNLLELNTKKDLYKEIYEIRNKEIQDFFEKHNSDRLIVCDLLDPLKWKKIGNFFGFSVPDNYQMHSNKSKK